MKKKLPRTIYNSKKVVRSRKRSAVKKRKSQTNDTNGKESFHEKSDKLRSRRRRNYKVKDHIINKNVENIDNCFNIEKKKLIEKNVELVKKEKLIIEKKKQILKLNEEIKIIKDSSLKTFKELEENQNNKNLNRMDKEKLISISKKNGLETENMMKSNLIQY